MIFYNVIKMLCKNFLFLYNKKEIVLIVVEYANQPLQYFIVNTR